MNTSEVLNSAADKMTARNPLIDAIHRALTAAHNLGATPGCGPELTAALTEASAAYDDLFAVVHDSRADLAAVGVAVTGEAVR